MILFKKSLILTKTLFGTFYYVNLKKGWITATLKFCMTAFLLISTTKQRPSEAILMLYAKYHSSYLIEEAICVFYHRAKCSNLFLISTTFWLESPRFFLKQLRICSDLWKTNDTCPVLPWCNHGWIFYFRNLVTFSIILPISKFRFMELIYFQ